MAGTLWLVGTPIGNLEDITERGRRVLADVDLIACEDTRRTGRLLQTLGIEGRKLISFFEGNEERRVPELVERLRAGQSVAVVTDGGMPAISDPGFRLVRACLEEGIAVDLAPGPSAAIAALVISGLPTDRFVFDGFLPRGGRARAERLDALASEPRTVVVFESPRRVTPTLRDLLMAGGDRRAAVVRELTKLHQEVIRGLLSDVLAQLEGRELKGEVVLVLEGARARPDLQEAVRVATELVKDGARKRDAAKQASRRTGVPAADVYSSLVSDAASAHTPAYDDRSSRND